MSSMAQRISIKTLPPPPPPPPPSGADGIRVMYDEDLSSRLHFKEEIGFGNWGSVWLCMPYAESSDGRPEPLNDVKVATKLVHRSKTATTKARVQSLWNEWKIVTSLGQSPHPSIIDFYSFVVSDSYALITMAYHPRLVSVEVPEPYAKEWFRSLLSGVQYLHDRGIAHNDIKPANILLSAANVPVIVDFGFAKQYDPKAADAFHSNLSYGTPEYLSPERAAGHMHDSRKSDVWSLGVTFFEILIGRTPFEKVEGEVFSTKEQLQKYWSLTLRGKWVGEWSLSPAMENLLRRMICPNADLRCTAAAAMADAYWEQSGSSEVKARASARSRANRKSAHLSSDTSNVDPRRIFDGVPYRQPRHKEGTESALPSWSKADKENVGAEERREKSKEKRKESEKDKEKAREKDKKTRSRTPATPHDKENVRPEPSTPSPRLKREKTRSSTILRVSRIGSIRHGRSQSQAQPTENTPPEKATPTRMHGGIHIPSLLGLGALSPASPVKYIPQSTVRPTPSPAPRKDADKENRVRQSPSPLHTSSSDSLRRKPLGPRKPSPPGSPALAPRTVLGDRTRTNGAPPAEAKPDSVVERMREWERERQRLRAREREEERRREAEADAAVAAAEQAREEREMRRDMERQRALEIELDRQREREEAEERARLEALREAHEREVHEERGRREAQALQQSGVRMHGRSASTCSPPPVQPAAPLSPLVEESESQLYGNESRSANESGLSMLKQSWKMSLDRTKRLYKSSTLVLGLAGGAGEDADYSRSRSTSFSTWEGESSEGVSPHPAIRHAAQNEEDGDDNQVDRMTLWLRNVEKVVEDARQNFAASVNTPLPPLPVAPSSRPPPLSPTSTMSRSQHSSRVRRRILPANQIFADESEVNKPDSGVSSPQKASTEPTSVVDLSIPIIPDENASQVSLVPVPCVPEAPMTPAHARARRATIYTRSPDTNRRKPSLEIEMNKHKEKSRSQHDLGRPITPVTRLQFELEQLPKPGPAPRLSMLLEKAQFIRDPVARRSSELFSMIEAPVEPVKDDLTASPFHVEPYPARLQPNCPTLDTPGRKHVEGVYDRFLMSTTGVRRVGLGYQSDAIAQPKPKPALTKRNSSFFHKRPMPPPVSSEDLRRNSMSPDEFGAMRTPAPASASTAAAKDDVTHSVSIVRRAIKAMTAKR
ncbi:protein kinase domain-containing protein [Phanerochaete sordida]|uniref:Protein kinase domain-containing protein n=1 Tax=Phanerochaete sordida TaxID=48140 RepID=A0A9P3G610_9APHY|nr:protein kinase domain-containing protein [Phanerochaete sordida]